MFRKGEAVLCILVSPVFWLDRILVGLLSRTKVDVTISELIACKLYLIYPFWVTYLNRYAILVRNVFKSVYYLGSLSDVLFAAAPAQPYLLS